VGLEGLTTYKYVLRGHGHLARDYQGPQARPFLHRRHAQCDSRGEMAQAEQRHDKIAPDKKRPAERREGEKARK
jgi:hypothetical protein